MSCGRGKGERETRIGRKGEGKGKGARPNKCV